MKQKDFLFLLISISILAVVWIIFNIIHSVTTSTINKTVMQQIAPLQPKFNTAIIDQLKQRQIIQASQLLPSLSPTPIQSEPTPTKELSPTPAQGPASLTPVIEETPMQEVTPTEGAGI